MNGSICVCAHPHEAHEHYRAGSDCALCGATACRRFRAANSLQARLVRLLHAAKAVRPEAEPPSNTKPSPSAESTTRRLLPPGLALD